MTEVLLYGNDNVIEVRGLRNALTGAFLNAATVSMSLYDSSGNAVTGQTFPTTLAYVPDTDGVYRGMVLHSAGITANKKYTMRVSVNGGAGMYGEWDIPCLCKFRS